MMTPQEVSSRAFARATLGGYNMAMVDEFLDVLTEDYTALYNDNAILKNKLKVLSDTVEEYRATDDAMRKTLLAAQRMAESMVSDAEAKRSELVREAEEAARQRVNELRAEIAAEEYRLQAAQESTAAYVAELARLFEGQREFLTSLSHLAPKVATDEERVYSTLSDIEDAMSQLESEPAQPEPTIEELFADDTPVQTPTTPVSNVTRFDDLQFGRDYEIS